MRMTVFGTGYLGATHAACMAELGHEVLGVDVDEAKIERLRRGEVPFYEPGLPEILLRHVESGRLRFTTDYAEAAAFADLHFIGVGTPQRKGEFAADTSHVEDVVARLTPLLSADAAVVGKSTVPVGTAARLQQIADSRAPDGVRVEVLWNPEFLREGWAVQDTIDPDRLVAGVPAGPEGERAAEPQDRALEDEVEPEGAQGGGPVAGGARCGRGHRTPPPVVRAARVSRTSSPRSGVRRAVLDGSPTASSLRSSSSAAPLAPSGLVPGGASEAMK